MVSLGSEDLNVVSMDIRCSKDTSRSNALPFSDLRKRLLVALTSRLAPIKRTSPKKLGGLLWALDFLKSSVIDLSRVSTFSKRATASFKRLQSSMLYPQWIIAF